MFFSTQAYHPLVCFTSCFTTSILKEFVPTLYIVQLLRAAWAANQSADPANASWRETNVTQGRPPKLTQLNELFLTLVRLRLNLKEHDLARLFKTSLPSVSRVFITWINYAYLHLGMLPIWPDRATIKETMPAAFKEQYPNTI